MMQSMVCKNGYENMKTSRHNNFWTPTKATETENDQVKAGVLEFHSPPLVRALNTDPRALIESSRFCFYFDLLVPI